MLGLSHRTADVSVREKVAFTGNRLPEALQGICACPSVRGAVVLSTCNRMEIYVQAEDRDVAWHDILSFISTNRGVDAAEIEPHLYSATDGDVVSHLFSVVCSLDSMVLGEQQIIAQVRNAFKVSVETGTMTLVLSRLFRQALEVGKRVLSQTDISRSHVSVSTVAIDVAREAFPDLAERNVLIVGSGEMCELAARYLFEQGVRSFIVSSRTHAHACSLARELGGTPRQFDELPELLRTADIVITGTAAPHCIIGPEMLAANDHPLLVLDIAMPRDVDPACAECPQVTVCDLDCLGRQVQANQEHRREAAQEAQHIVDEETEGFIRWVEEHGVTPTIKEMRARAESVRVGEVEHLLRSLDADLSERDRMAIEKATSAIVNKLLHEPTARMRESVVAKTDFECVEAARFLFGLSHEQVEHSRVLAEDASVAAGH